MTERPKVLFVNASGILGGAEHSLLLLLRGLSDLVDASVVLLEEGPLREELVNRGISATIVTLSPTCTSSPAASSFFRVGLDSSPLLHPPVGLPVHCTLAPCEPAQDSPAGQHLSMRACRYTTQELVIA